ncbi:MAG: PHB depolymerase family esterase, partial [bacterium]
MTRTYSASRLLLALLVPALSGAQALTNVTSVYVGYISRKNTTKLDAELKARLDTVEAAVTAATKLGRMGEVRRQYAKGNVLLAGRPWTDAADYNASLLLRTDRVIVESQKPWSVRIEQLYAPAIDLTRSLQAHATLMMRGAGAGQPAKVVKDFGVVEGVSRDLRENPELIDLDLHDVADGRYVVNVEILDSARVLGSTALGISVRKGIDSVTAALERDAAGAPVALRAAILFPVDRMRMVNRGVLELRTFDADKDIAAAQAIAAAARGGKDPYAGKTGDIKRYYTLDAAKEVMPYHTLVPSSYTAARAYPLLIMLHGLGGTEDAFFDSYGRKLPELAEQRGYILAAPLGYRVDGFYGWGIGAPPSDPSQRRLFSLSEADVMEVVTRMRALYNIDPKRIYLAGHSMGAIGAWRMGPKFADLWASVGAFSGQGSAESAERMKAIPQFVVHGDTDPTVNVSGSRNMVAAMKRLNMDVKYIEVPGGNHSSVVEPNFSAM